MNESRAVKLFPTMAPQAVKPVPERMGNSHEESQAAKLFPTMRPQAAKPAPAKTGNPVEDAGRVIFDHESPVTEEGHGAPAAGYKKFDAPEGVDDADHYDWAGHHEISGLFKSLNLSQAQAQTLVTAHFREIQKNNSRTVLKGRTK
jgi:hypothetical protein